MTRKNWLLLVGMLALGIGIFWYEIRTINFGKLIQALFHMNGWWLLAALMCMVFYWLFEAFVLQVFLKDKNTYFPLENAIRIPMIEQLFNAITPFSAGGQPAQLVGLMQSGIEAGRASSVLLMKFVVYQFMVLINFVFTIFIGFNQVKTHFGTLAIFIIFGFVFHIIVIAGLLMVMYYYKFTKKLVEWCFKPLKWFVSAPKLEQWKKTMNEKIDSFYHESLALKRDKRKVIIASILTFIQLFFYYSVPYFVILALGYTHVNFVEVIVLHVMIVMIVSLFPIPGGSGGAEYSFKSLFATFIPAPAKLVLGMLLWRIFTYYSGMFVGIIALAIRPKKPKQNKSGV